MSTKQESVSDAAFKTWPFLSDFNFASKDYRVMAATCKYCPLVVSPTITNCCKELHLKYGKIPRSVFENYTWKLVWFCVKTNLFSCYFEMWSPLSKVIVFFCVTFTVWWSIFDQSFRQLLPLSLFYGSSHWLFKIKITCKRVNFIKK